MIPLIYIMVGLGTVAIWLALAGRPSELAYSESMDGSDMPPSIFYSLSNYTPCGVDGIDRLPLAPLVEEEFGSTATIALARAVVAICWCETGGKTEAPVIGDTTLQDRGPSIGPLQVSRGTAIDLGIVPKSETHAQFKARASNETWCLRQGVKIFATKLAAAKGDVADAIRRYNGSGSRAEQYRDKALSFLAEKYGESWAEG